MAEQVGFKRNMGLFMAVMIGIGATMGPGIFALPGELAHMTYRENERYFSLVASILP